VETGEKEVLLVIADISGYTRFIAANRDTLTHSQIVITELMRAVLKELKVPLKVAKLEGDAVFFYLCIQGNEKEIGGVADGFRARIERMFAAFHRRVAQLVRSNLCPCAGCKSVEMLRLKMVIHSGSALFYRLDRFTELSGLDVILVHRLLKNSVAGDEYVLLSEAARNTLFSPDETMFEEGEERYEEIGAVSTYVYRPHTGPVEAAPGSQAGPFERWRSHQVKIWTARLLGWGLLRFGPFHNLPDVADTSSTTGGP
jgi:hypothetical protein